MLDGDAEVFNITKRLHNLLHGDRGDAGRLGQAEHDHYRQVLASNLESLLSRVSPLDIVVLHDPQPAGLVDGLRDTGVRVAWRCHVGRDAPNELTDTAWAFVRPYIERADAFVFSRRVYAAGWLDDDRLVVIPPSIDPFSAKNRDLDTDTVRNILATVGLVSGVDAEGPRPVGRRDGTQGTLRCHAGLLDGPPPPHDARLVVQVSRWDRLKEMVGVSSR